MFQSIIEKRVLDGDGHDGGQFSDGRRVVLLNPHQPSQDVVAVARPTVHVRVQQPVGNVTLQATQTGGGGFKTPFSTLTGKTVPI